MSEPRPVLLSVLVPGKVPEAIEDGWPVEMHVRKYAEMGVRQKYLFAAVVPKRWDDVGAQLRAAQDSERNLQKLWASAIGCAEKAEADLMAEVAIKDGATATWKRDHDVQLDLYRKLEATLESWKTRCARAENGEARTETSNAALRGALERIASDHTAHDRWAVQIARNTLDSTDAGRAYLDVVEAAKMMLAAYLGQPKLLTGTIVEQHRLAVDRMADALDRLRGGDNAV